jgi:hypothetical protein
MTVAVAAISKVLWFLMGGVRLMLFRVYPDGTVLTEDFPEDYDDYQEVDVPDEVVEYIQNEM